VLPGGMIVRDMIGLIWVSRAAMSSFRGWG
jgi:hypothetical protein